MVKGDWSWQQEVSKYLISEVWKKLDDNMEIPRNVDILVVKTKVLLQWSIMAANDISQAKFGREMDRESNRPSQ